MDPSQLAELLTQPESATLDFKERLQRASKAQDVVVAMSNGRGGVMVVGVGDKQPRKLAGVERGQDFEERVQEVARTVQPPVALGVQWCRHEGKDLALVEVPAIKNGFVQTSDGRLLVRAGPTNRQLMGQELVRFVLERGGQRAEDSVVEGVTVQDLDQRAVRAYLARRLSSRVTDVPARLKDLGFITPTGDVRLSTLLLFGQRPQAVYRRLGIEILRYAGALYRQPVLREKVELTGRLDELVSEADRRIYDELRRDAVVRGLVREEVPEYPPVAVREALLNAVGHRDYAQRGSSVQVRLYDDAVEIESPGGLAGYVTVTNLRDAQYSRNERIMESFQQLGLVEEAGEGIGRMYQALEDALLAEPEFEERDGSFVVRFRGRSVFSAEDRLWVAQFSGESLSAAAKVALVFARKQGAVTNEDLQGLRALDGRSSRRVLQDLVLRGLLQVSGQGRGTRYNLSDRAQASAAPRAHERVDAIVQHAQRTGSVANSDVRGLLDVDRQEALRLLDRAVAQGRLRPVGERRGRTYLPT